MLLETDKQIVRELAKTYMALVCTEKQERMWKRFRDTNDLKMVRPPLLLDEIPWQQMDIDKELTCLCQDEEARKVEYYFRKALFYLKHFKADNHFRPFYPVKRAVDSTGINLTQKVGNMKKTGEENVIVPRI